MDKATTAVTLEAYRCGRISLGDFERGPIYFMIETHSNADFPPACMAETPGTTRFKVVSNVWTDDAEIGAFLATTYGLPIQVISVQEQDQDQGPVSIHNWTWQVGTNPASTLAIVDDEQAAQDAPVYARYFWPAASGLIQLEVAPDEDGPTGERAASGILQSPHLLASDTGGRFQGQAEWYPRREAVGEFTFFADMNCEQPIP